MNTQTRRSGTLPTALVILAALAAGLGLWAGQKLFLPPSGQPQVTSLRLLDAPRVLPAFQLQGTAGGQIDAAALQGRWTLVFLGFTHCPDVCPTTLADLSRAEKRWADLPEAQRPRILFVSVDPERDKPEALNKYAAYFSPTVMTATGEIDALTRFASSLNMVFAKAPLDGGDYTIDHTAWVAVLDAQARLAGFIRPPLDPVAIAADLRTLVEAAP